MQTRVCGARLLMAVFIAVFSGNAHFEFWCLYTCSLEIGLFSSFALVMCQRPHAIKEEGFQTVESDVTWYLEMATGIELKASCV